MEKRRASEKAKEAGVPTDSENAPPSYDEVMGKDLAFSFYFPEVSRTGKICQLQVILSNKVYCKISSAPTPIPHPQNLHSSLLCLVPQFFR